MTCFVCNANWSSDQGSVCPACKYNMKSPTANDPVLIDHYRSEYQASIIAFNPKGRVGIIDRITPYGGLALGMLLFIFFLRACSTMGWQIF